jgi:glycogen debranching enzyme
MLHFTPLQTRGESGSPYSILDQLRFDGELLKDKKSDGVEEVNAMVKRCREDFGLLSLTDVVLNHTANNSPWLGEHPESGQAMILST